MPLQSHSLNFLDIDLNVASIQFMSRALNTKILYPPTITQKAKLSHKISGTLVPLRHLNMQ